MESKEQQQSLALAWQMGIRRRCFWCGVHLRQWQLNSCRACKRAIIQSPTPAVGHLTRCEDQPDNWKWRAPYV